jgi:hypothetical protein
MNGQTHNPRRSARCTSLSRQYAAELEPAGQDSGIADDAVSVLLPDEPPALTPEAARALLRLLLSIRQEHMT